MVALRIQYHKSQLVCTNARNYNADVFEVDLIAAETTRRADQWWIKDGACNRQ